ncbi:MULTISPECIES: hypothetical protein [Halorussus]|uniref:hypothetical protein n=1 Tax=Halorussus TaxID=1070314 RepID=UPI0013B44360|nr:MULTISPECIES: hypothetical protein [Halorussus]NHN58566.1 hypothetical protein [Halorussus sp. JP-T4]
MGEALETIETVGTDESLTLTSIQPESQEYLDDKKLSVRFGIQIPFLQTQSITDPVTITPCDTQIADDGSLYVECQATIRQQETSNHARPSEGEESSKSSLGQTETEISNEPDQISPSKDCPTAVDGKEPKTDTESDESVEPSESDLSSEPQGTASPEKGIQSGNGETDKQLVDFNNSTDEENDSHGSSNRDNNAKPSKINVEPTNKEPSRPPYRDPDQLEAVYEKYDTFAEMTDALEVDVTSQTVRRYMIQHGIHEPASRSGPTSADSLLEMDPDEIPALNGSGRDQEDGRETDNQESRTGSSQDAATNTLLVTDGNGAKIESESASGQESSLKASESQNEPTETTIESAEEEGDEGDGHSKQEKIPTNSDNLEIRTSDIADFVDLPSDLTLSEVKTVVQEVKTLYEAQQRLDLERDETRHLLQELDLLDLVQGRLATRELEERTIEDINRRIQSASVASEGNKD